MTVIQMPQTRRRNRSPEYDFHLRHRAYVIQPFLYAPVRAGETLKSMGWMSRAVSDPIKNPLMGWHLEYYFFYVQLQDLCAPGTEDTALKFLWDGNVSAETAPPNGFGPVVTRLENYSVAGSGTDFRYLAYKRIVEEFFRDQGETWNSAHKMSGALALARRNRKDFMESKGYDPSPANADPLTEITVGADDVISAEEIVGVMERYAMLSQSAIGSVTTFEDYLASQGQGAWSDISRAYRPELIRFIKEWTYPTNTVEPTTGVPSSAVSWSISSRADKDRFFREPGFIVGVTLARPKTLTTSTREAVDTLVNQSRWLPKGMTSDASSATESVRFDTFDLFEYGGQFLNWDPAGSYNANQITWQDVAGSGAGPFGVYPVESSINSRIWVSATNNNVRQDGRVMLNILTDLPKDQHIGEDTADSAAMAANENLSLKDLATEYAAKLNERRKGNSRVKLPDITAMAWKGLLPVS